MVKKRLSRGIWIAFEGNDGSGKTTQLEGFVKYLEGLGHSVIKTREPGGNNYSEQIRKLIFDPEIANDQRSQLLLFVVSRRRNIVDVVLPALEAGQIVVSDRSEKSTFAYQHYQFGLPFNRVFEVNEFATEGVRPDLTILLDVDVDVAFKRMAKAKGKRADYFDTADRENWLKRQQGYLELTKKFNNWIVVDANKSPDEVLTEIIKKFKKRAVLNG